MVGDDAQAIYSFRAATVENILGFPAQYAPPAAVLTLEENFRSSEGVVKLAHAFIEQNHERLDKEMKPTAAQAYEKGDLVGSLVVSRPGDPRRPTAWDGASGPPADVAWWDFPGLLERWWNRRPGAGIR